MWQRSLCSNLAGIDPEKLCRTTSYASATYVVASYGSRFFDCLVNIWETCKNLLGKWFTAPWQKIARTSMLAYSSWF